MKISYHIGEIARYFGVSTDTLRLYERKGILSPQKEENGYRVYSREDMIFLDYVIRLRRLGLPLKEIESLVHKGSMQDAEQVMDSLSRKLLARMEELNALYAAAQSYRSTLRETMEDLENIRVATSPRMILRHIGDSSLKAIAAFEKLGAGLSPCYCTLTSPHDILADDSRFNIYDYHVRNSALTNAVVVIDRDGAVSVPEKYAGEFFVLPPQKCIFMAARCRSGTDYEAFVRLRRFMLDGGYTATGDMLSVFVAVRCGPRHDDYYQVYFPIA